jgi:hypothetical protein
MPERILIFILLKILIFMPERILIFILEFLNLNLCKNGQRQPQQWKGTPIPVHQSPLGQRMGVLMMLKPEKGVAFWPLHGLTFFGPFHGPLV